jgi:hypothetical protein
MRHHHVTSVIRVAIATARVVLLPAAATVLLACSPGPSGGGSTSPTTGVASAGHGAGSVCERKLLAAEEVDDILAARVTGTKPLAGDPQTCYFITSGEGFDQAELMVSLRPGVGVATLATYTSGKMDDFARSEPLAAVGEVAVWLPELREVAAQKNNVLCDVRASNVRAELRDDSMALRKRLGAVCNRVFAKLP